MRETRPHVRLAADWTSDPDILGIDAEDRPTAIYVYFGLMAASRRAEAYGTVAKATKVIKSILAGMPGTPGHIIDVLTDADLADHDADRDVLTLTQWAEWQQTEEEVTVGQARRSAKAKAAADARWAAQRAKDATGTADTSASDAPSMLGACGEDAQPCLDMQEEKRTEEKRTEPSGASTRDSGQQAQTQADGGGDINLVKALIEAEAIRAGRSLSSRDLTMLIEAVTETASTYDRQRCADALAEALQDEVKFPASIYLRAVERGPQRPLSVAPVTPPAPPGGRRRHVRPTTDTAAA
jgi:hypothetical protein